MKNWFLPESLLAKLESFRAEIGRRILALSHVSTQVVPFILHWDGPLLPLECLLKKLAFLSRVLENSNTIGHNFYNGLLESSIEGSMQLIAGWLLLP